MSPAQAAEPGDRDQQVDVDRALAGDGAAEQHHRLAGDDEADEGAGLGEGEDADQQVGPGAERVGDVLEQLLEVDVAGSTADQVVAGDHRGGDQRHAAPACRRSPLRRQPHAIGASRLADDRVVAVDLAPAAARAAARSAKRPKAVGPGAGQQRQRRARLAQGVERRRRSSGRSERAAGSRSLTSSSA